jgi:hypothetical protein
MTLNSGIATRDRLTARTGALRAGLGLSELSLAEFRQACARLGDTVTEAELEAALRDGHELDDRRYDIAARAINDRLVEIGLTPMIPRADEI